jgi:hypothetical protein
VQHCWHDSSAKFPPGPTQTVDAPAGQGRVCCYCGEVRPEPLPPRPPRWSHGPYVEDNTGWFVVDEVECPGMELIQLNPETVAVDVEVSGSGGAPGTE